MKGFFNNSRMLAGMVMLLLLPVSATAVGPLYASTEPHFVTLVPLVDHRTYYSDRLLVRKIGWTQGGPVRISHQRGVEQTAELVVVPSALRPRISTELHSKVRRSLSRALAIATSRLHAHAACRALFAEFGADGLRELASTLYHAASESQERRYCIRRLAAAFTTVGNTQTWLCHNFSSLSENEATVILIHEALHHAGLNEKPRDANGGRERPAGLLEVLARRVEGEPLTSPEINRLVENSCRL